MKLSHLSFAVAAAAVTFSFPAAAADLGQRFAKPTPAVAMAPSFTWTGFYVGANAGYAFGRDNKATTIGTPAFNTLIAPGIVPGSLKTGRDGFTGGLQAGFNYQFGAAVAGIEADINLMPKGGRGAFIGNPVLATQLITSARSELNYLGTLRGRLGFAADRLLVYATGGLAYGDVDASASVVGVQAPALVWAGNRSGIRAGYTVGAGLEYAIMPNLTLRGEYLYYDLGQKSVAALGNAAVRGVGALNGIDYVTKTETRGSLLRTGINYKF